MRSIDFFLKDISDTYTSEYPHQLGAIYEGQDPTTGAWQQWIFVKATTVLAKGQACMRTAGSVDPEVDAATAGAVIHPIRLIGVAQHAIAAASFGWILRQGIGEVLTGSGGGGGATANTALTTGGVEAGSAIDVVANASAILDTGAEVFAFSTETVAATAFATCNVNCRGA